MFKWGVCGVRTGTRCKDGKKYFAIILQSGTVIFFRNLSTRYQGMPYMRWRHYTQSPHVRYARDLSSPRWWKRVTKDALRPEDGISTIISVFYNMKIWNIILAVKNTYNSTFLPSERHYSVCRNISRSAFVTNFVETGVILSSLLFRSKIIETNWRLQFLFFLFRILW